MPFIPRLPTFNQQVTIFRLDALGAWNADASPTDCQVYMGQRNLQLTWVDEVNTQRGTAGTADWQTSQYNIFLLVPKTATPRDPLDVRAATLFAVGARDYFEYNNPNLGLRTYWIDQVEARWPGFPNEHKIIIATRRGYNP